MNHNSKFLSELWKALFRKLDSNLNNIKSNSTSKMPNKIVYEFSLNVIFILNIAAKSILPLSVFQIEVADAVDFIKMNIKYHYNQKHQLITMKIENYTLLKLLKDYFISVITNKKLDQQYVKLFQIIEKIEWLVYRLNILFYWYIHLIFTIVQLKFCSLFYSDSYWHS